MNLLVVLVSVTTLVACVAYLVEGFAAAGSGAEVCFGGPVSPAGEHDPETRASNR